MSGVNRPELLSPAGSMESLKAAVNGGCDAVYLGGKQFSARQYAGNFDLKELEDACDYCHLRGVKVYVTVNTVYKPVRNGRGCAHYAGYRRGKTGKGAFS